LEIWHRVSIAGKDAGYWQSRGLKMKPILSALDAEGRPKSWIAEISESDSRWEDLKACIHGLDFVNTFFTDEERLAAEWCTLRGVGGLKPAEPVGGNWSSHYYQGRCPVCGSGWTQIAPFHLATEPQVGRSTFASFASAAYQLFASREVFEAFQMEGIRGADSWPILVGKEKHPAESVKQLLVEGVAAPALDGELLEHEHYRESDCPGCGRHWHLFYTRGMLPLRRSALMPNVDLLMTHEWFGSGKAARREILVSRRVVRVILANKWRGAELSPVHTV
jgi:hypothetical protein